MAHGPQHDENSVGLAESRAHARLQVHSLAYIDLSDDNAGLILNISETGLAVQAVQVLTCDSFPHMRFRLPKTEDMIEVAGRMVWQIRSKKEAGIEFVEVAETAKAQIRKWIAEERARSGASSFDVTRESEPSETTSQRSNAAQFPSAKPEQPRRARPKLTDRPEAVSGRAQTPQAEDAQPASGDVPPVTAQGSGDWTALAGRVGDLVSQLRRSARAGDVSHADGHSGLKSDANAEETAPHTEHPSRFHLPPLRVGRGSYGAPVYGAGGEGYGPDRMRAMPRWNGYTAPGVGMGLKKSRPWWTYTAALGFLGAIVFAAVITFNPDTATKGRMEALTRMGNTPANTAQAPGQNGAANNQQQNNPSTQAEQNPQPAVPDSEFPLPDDDGSNPSANQPPAGEAALSATAPATTSPSGGKNYRHTNTKSPRTSRPGVSANREGSLYRNRYPSRYGSAFESQKATRPNASAATSRETPYQPGSSSNTRAAEYQPKTESNPSGQAGSANGGNRARQQSAAQASSGQAQTSLPPGNSTSSGANSAANQRTARQPEQDAKSPESANSTARSQQSVRSSSPFPTGESPAGVPSGSVSANSQFHAIRIPAELQSQNPQLTGQLQIGQVVSINSPVYPIEAAREGIEGTVRLDVTVGTDGTVRSVRVLSGPAILTSAAANAVRDWRYGVTFLAGQPIETQQYVTVVFRLAVQSQR